ncbi:hypothetical protein ACIQ7D_17545 [Streptomyces sp. NPDC096310]|uniref:hypothetical protein n=1 Tax=Streptomyces sp. NPDC096310 TaxID=3366082 RepID=UPI00382E6002
MPAEVTGADLAAELIQASRTAGAADPQVRGADWRTGTVTSVNVDGTVTIGAIRARRIPDAYPSPVVGDWIVISQSGTGNWIAHGRLASATASNGAWAGLGFGTGYSAASGYQAPQYRVIGDTVHLRGSFTKSSTLGYGDVLTTLPVGARPNSDTDIVLICSQGTNGATYGACRGILRASTGAIEYRGPASGTLVALPPTPLWLN